MPKILIKSGDGVPSTANVVDSELAFNRTKGTIYVGSGTASGGAATSVVEMTRVDHVHGNLTNVGKISGTTTAGSVVKTIANGDLGALALGTAGQVLKVNSGATDIEWGAAGGTGTVTSVALSLPDLFSVSGSPITTTGTLAAALATKNANIVFAGPSTGSAAAPTFRSLVSADLPDIDGGTY